ncbi:Shikimate kinase [Geodia barretti]|uniref:Shikimate kinase n=1 Tax=Geodia barretti TaxID=519541 RepID=A0AA35WAS4_GEOBA|nr:Shikimate kinase [Geodia barretti]
MGAGKSSVGVALAVALEWRFVDLDRLIEEEQGRTIPRDLRGRRRAGFRAAETTALHRLSGAERTVLAVGGGAPVQRANRAFFRDWMTFYLAAPLAELAGADRQARRPPAPGPDHRATAGAVRAARADIPQPRHPHRYHPQTGGRDRGGDPAAAALGAVMGDHPASGNLARRTAATLACAAAAVLCGCGRLPSRHVFRP